MRKGRLLRLAKHLESGDLLHEKFDFFHINAGKKETQKGVKNCGSLGCALGELPALWPKVFQFDTDGWLVGDYPSYFFDLVGRETGHLFSPDQQHPRYFGGKVLGGNATAKEVAANIRAFVNIKSKLSTI